MRSKLRFYVAALAALLVGLPLAERAMADDTGDIVGTSIGAAFDIVAAALEAS